MIKINRLLPALAFIFIFIANSIITSNKSKVKKSVNNKYKIAILGSGPAGTSAGIYAGRAQLNNIVFNGKDKGGQLAKAGIIENWPGKKRISGQDLIDQITEHAQSLGANFIDSQVQSVDFSRHPFILFTDDDQKILADTVIIATGSKPTKLNRPGESKYLGKGVAVCADCDRALYKDKEIVLIGGNIEALREIEKLKNFTDKITIINDDSELNGPLPLLNKVKNNPNIKVKHNREVIEILGNEEHATGVKVFNNQTQQEETINADGIFVALGWQPASEIFEDQLELDNKKHIKIFNNTNTSIDGVFAAGDVASNSYHQALPASAQGYAAAMDAEKYLRKNKLI